MPNKIPNIIRAERKRLQLSQWRLARLASVSRDAISDLERFVSVPGLEFALALEAIFDKPVRTLFPGVFEVAQQKVALQGAEASTRISRTARDPSKVQLSLFASDQADKQEHV